MIQFLRNLILLVVGSVVGCSDADQSNFDEQVSALGGKVHRADHKHIATQHRTAKQSSSAPADNHAGSQATDRATASSSSNKPSAANSALVVDLSNTPTTDQDVAKLVEFSAAEKIESLSLANTRITREALVPLVGLRDLRTLDIRYTTLDADAIEYLSQLTQVKYFALDGMNISPMQMESLRAVLPADAVISHDPRVLK